MNIFKLFGSIYVDSDEANKSLAKTDDKAEGVGNTLVSTAKKAGGFGLKVAGAAAAGGAAMFKLADKVGETAQQILEFSSITGMTTTAIQKWSRVSTVAGVPLENLLDVGKELNTKMAELAGGSGAASEALEALGYTYADLENLNADQRLDLIVSALGGVEDKTDRAIIGTQLLGGAYEKLAPILDVGAEEMKKIKDNADIISPEDIEKANDFRIKVDEMQERIGVFGQKIAVEAMPFLSDMMDTLSENGPVLEELFTAALEAIELLLPVLIEVLGYVTKIIEGAIKGIEKLKEIKVRSEEAEASGESKAKFEGSTKHHNVANRVNGLASGGETITSGIVKVGERGPEMLSLPAGARVKPLDNGAGSNQVTLNLNGATFVNEQGIEDMMDLMVNFLISKGVQVV